MNNNGQKKNKAWRSVALSASGYAMDGFDLLLISFMLPVLEHDLGFSALKASSLMSMTLVGSVIGGVLFGCLADWVGRVKVLAWSILLFSLFTGLCACAQGYGDLSFYRVMSGVGLGGEFGIGMALVAETWPKRYRARASSYVGLGWQCGVLMASLSVPFLLPILGWRSIFLLGASPALFSFFVRFYMQEPSAYEQEKAVSSKDTSFLKHVTKDKHDFIRAAGIVALCSIQNFGYYGVMIWMPSYLSGHLGYSVTRSSLWMAVSVMGMMLGLFGFGEVADRFGQVRAFSVWMLGACCSIVVYVFLQGAPWLLLMGAVMGFFVNGMIGGYGALMSSCYPSEIRATAQNVLFNVGRMIGGAGPIVVSLFTKTLGASWAVGFLAILYIIDLYILHRFVRVDREVV